MTKRGASWGLYLISDETMLRDGSFLPFLEKALKAGLRVVQLRAKSLPDDTLLELGVPIRRLTREHDADFIVNDRVDLALRLEADGVHLGQGDTSPEEARRLLGPSALVGLSTHDRRQIFDAQSRPVDYIGIGPIFPTQTKPDAEPAVGIAMLGWAARMSSLPVVAIGGITLANLDDVLRAGPANAAVISAIGQSPDPLKATREFLERIDRAVDERKKKAES